MHQDVQAVGQRGGDARARVGCGDVEREGGAAEPVGHAPGVLLGLRYVEDDDPGAVPRQRLGDRLADAARGAGDQGGAAGEGAVGVVGWVVGCGDVRRGRTHLDDLAADVRRPGGEEEAQGRLGGVRVRQPYEIHRPAAPDLLAERAREALQGLLDGGLVVVGRVEGRAQDDDPAAVGDRPHDRVQGRVHLGERLDVTDARGVQDDGGGLLGGGGRQVEAAQGGTGIGIGETEVRLAGRQEQPGALQ